MPPRIILWDIMDTLVRDPYFTHVPAYFGQTFEALVARLRPQTWVEFELGRLSEPEFYERFFQDGSAIDGPGLKRCMSDAYAWVDGMKELLGDLRARAVTMHALSNYPAWYQVVEQRLGVAKYVQLSFISCRTGLRKPAPEAYLQACAKLECAPDECLFIDDRESNCQAARALGLYAHCFDGDVESLRRQLGIHKLL